MKYAEIQNPSDNHIQKIAEELAMLSGICEEIKEIQLNCVTTDDFETMSNNLIEGVGEKVDGFMQEGNLPFILSVTFGLENWGIPVHRFLIPTASYGLYIVSEKTRYCITFFSFS